jgi:hypothetical protein
LFQAWLCIGDLSLTLRNDLTENSLNGNMRDN